MNHATQSISSQNPLLQLQHPAFNFPWAPMVEKAPIEDPCMVKRLVNNLKYLFNIDSGDYLTFVLGHGECSTNDSALQCWVLDQLANASIGPDALLEYLIKQLKEQIRLEVLQ